MSKFVETNKGAVNLDYVSEIVKKPLPDGSIRHSLYGPKGESFGYVENMDYSLCESFSAQVIPAQSNHCAMVVYDLTSADEPTEIVVEYPFILAWRIQDFPQPVFAEWTLNEGASPYHMIFIEDANGSWRLPDEAVFKTEAEAKEYAINQFTKRRQHKNVASTH